MICILGSVFSFCASRVQLAITFSFFFEKHPFCVLLYSHMEVFALLGEYMPEEYSMLEKKSQI